MGEITGKILAILASIAVFILIIAGIIWPAIQDKSITIEQQIISTNP